MKSDIPMNTETIDGRADVSVMEIAQEGARNREELARRMRRLARTLNEEADKMGADGTYRPNSLGVVQREGQEIDRLCAVIDAQKEALKRMTWVVKGEEK